MPRAAAGLAAAGLAIAVTSAFGQAIRMPDLSNRGNGVQPFTITAHAGWTYLSVAHALRPDEQNYRLRLEGSAPHLWSGRARLTVILDEKYGLQERTGLLAGGRFQTRHEIRALSLEVAPRGQCGGILGRHRPLTTALGVNDIDGATVRYGRARAAFQASLFGGYSVEYWESHVETERPVVGGVLRAGAAGRGPNIEVSAIRESVRGGTGRTRAGAAGEWRAHGIALDGRGEIDLTSHIVPYARLYASGRFGPKLTPFVEFGQRRALLFTEASDAVQGVPDTLGAGRALQFAGAGGSWRATSDLFVDGRVSIESGLRRTQGGDLSFRHEKLPHGFGGRLAFGGATSVWANSEHASLGMDHGLGGGRIGGDLGAVGYRWRRPGLSSSTRWRWTPAVRMNWPLRNATTLLLSVREIFDDWGSVRTEATAWVHYRFAP